MADSAPVAAGNRLDWSEVPAEVRAAIEVRLGSRIVTATTRRGGFSPGLAARVVCADGSQAFVKACGTALNPDSPELNRAEIHALELLPDEVPHARLLSAYDDGDWVALVLEDVEGQTPQVPWTDTDVAAMTTALGKVATTPASAGIPPFAEKSEFLDSWDLVAADGTGVRKAVLDRLPELLSHQQRARQVTVGDALVHWDARNDNVIIRDGEAVLLDWAWACRGAPWLDTLLLCLDLRIQGGPDPDALLERSQLTRGVPAADLQSVVACAVGIWTERARRPAPPGLPTIRPWQAHCAELALTWLDAGALWR